MKLRCLLAAAVFVSGCASTIPEMRERGPIKSYSSAKPEQELAQCIMFAWQNQSIAGSHDEVSLQPRQGGGQTIIDASMRHIADVYRSPSATKVDFFSNNGNVTWVSDRRMTSLQTCL